MRYWHPSRPRRRAEVAALAPDEIVLLPLYPQYSTTTTDPRSPPGQAAAAAGLSDADPRRLLLSGGGGFIAALAELTRAATGRGAAPPAARRSRRSSSPPMACPEDRQARRSLCRAGRCDLPRPGGGDSASRTSDWELGFQSRVGPLEWVGPSTDELIVAAAEAEAADPLVPVAFVSEHSETLVELDIEYRKLADRAWRAGIYVRVPTVGTHPAFIAGLARCVAPGAGRRRAPSAAIGRRAARSAASRCPLDWPPARVPSHADSIPGCSALHIIAVIAWMAACSICRGSTSITRAPRPGSELSETFKVMERRLLRGIINPAMIGNLDSGAAAGLAGRSLGRGLVPRQARAARSACS